MKLRLPFLIISVFLIGGAIASYLGMLDRDACLDAGGRWITDRGACDVAEGTTFVPVSRRVGIWLAWAAGIGVLAFLLAWARHHRRVVKDRTAPVRDVYVYIEEDGSARGITPDEAVYLSTEFKLGDGAAPYIKSHYRQRNALGSPRGFLARRDLPKRIVVRPADAGDG